MLVLIGGSPFDGVPIQKMDTTPMRQLFEAGCRVARAAVRPLALERSILWRDAKEVFGFVGESGKVEFASGVLIEEFGKEKVHVGLSGQGKSIHIQCTIAHNAKLSNSFFKNLFEDSI